MNLTTLTATQLRQALALREQIERLEQQLAAITGSTVVNVVEPRAEPDVESTLAEVKRVKKVKPAKRGKRGAVKEAVIELVRTAGPAGTTVKEIAAALGRSSPSISLWFFSTGKKVKEIKKIGRGKYAWAGASELTADPYATIEAAARPRAEKPTRKNAKGSKRGKLKNTIINLLKVSGQSGISAKDVASSVGLPLARIYNWFLATGKKVKEIRKLGPGKYAWGSASTPSAPTQAGAKAKSAQAKGTKLSAKAYGGTKEAIINLIKASGKSGITVGEIAEKLGVKTGNIYSWFTSTGKKVKAIKKVGPGEYGWVG